MPKEQPKVVYPSVNSTSGDWMLHDEPAPNGNRRHPFDLEERTAQFGEAIIRFAKRIPHKPENNRLISQVAEPDLAHDARLLYREAKELMLIFASIYRK